LTFTSPFAIGDKMKNIKPPKKHPMVQFFATAGIVSALMTTYYFFINPHGSEWGLYAVMMIGAFFLTKFIKLFV